MNNENITDEIEEALWLLQQDRPYLEYPEVSRHPVVLALMFGLEDAMIERFGGLVQHRRALADAVKIWFAENRDAMECQYFIGRLFSDCGMAADGPLGEELGPIYWEMVRWSRRKEN